MDSELQQLEKALEGMRASGMPVRMKDRLSSAMNQAAQSNVTKSEDFELQKLEQALGNLSVNGMPEDMLQRLDSAMRNWGAKEQSDLQETEERNVVPFEIPASESRQKSWWSRGMAASAAAVALLGAISAFVGTSDPVMPAASVADVKVQPPTVVASKNIVSASEQEVVYSKNNQPHRSMKVEYMEEFNIKNEKGHELILQKPAVEYLFVPLKQD